MLVPADPSVEMSRSSRKRGKSPAAVALRDARRRASHKMAFTGHAVVWAATGLCLLVVAGSTVAMIVAAIGFMRSNKSPVVENALPVGSGRVISCSPTTVAAVSAGGHFERSWGGTYNNY